MSSKKSTQSSATFQRMNYIYQLMNVSMMLKNNTGSLLSSNYGKLLLSIGRKGLSRMEPEIKRTICKGCNVLLIPGETASVRLHKKPASRIVWKCLKCSSIRRYNLRPGYELWAEKDEAVIETVSPSDNKEDKSKDKNSEKKA
ncbi:ribonuclease P protein subunit Rpp21 [Lycorma delicatula]|uniref:ribonuclease P protein subunit Rpp21 n=1 Tax=Lycorma delicatula TaxID=130591 RepID=UPI003F510E15